MSHILKRTGIITYVIAFIITTIPFVGGEYSSYGKIVDTGTCGENLTWTFYDRGILQIEGTGDMYDYMNNSADGKWHPWWDINDDVWTLIVEDGVTSLGHKAFDYLRNLAFVYLPDTLKTIDDYAFESCDNITYLEIPKSVTSIGATGFYNEYMTIGGYKGTSAETFAKEMDYEFVNLDSVEKSGKCGTNLTWEKKGSTLIIEGTGKMFPFGENDYTGAGNMYICNDIEDINIKSGATNITTGLAYDFLKLKKVIIPGTVKSIAEYAFEGCINLKEVVIPDSVTSIAENAFYDCENFKILGEAGSYAEQYAGKHNIQFVEIATDNSFCFDTYKADYYVDDTCSINAGIEMMTIRGITFYDLYYTIENDKTFENEIKVWKGIHLAVNPANIGKEALDEKGYCEAIIFSVFKSKQNNQDMSNALLKETLSTTSSLTTMVSKWAKSSISIDVTGNTKLSSLTSTQKTKLKEEIDKLYSSEFPILAGTEKISAAIGTCFSACATVGDVLSKMTCYLEISTLSNGTKETINEMYRQCPDSNLILKGALKDAAYATNSADAAMNVSKLNILEGTTAQALDKGTDALWTMIIDASPYVKCFMEGAKVGTIIGDTVTSTLFSSDATVEQYIKMRYLIDFEKILKNVVDSSMDRYSSERTADNARFLFATVDAYFQTIYLSCDLAREWGRIINEDSAIGWLTVNNQGYDEYMQTIKSVKESIKGDELAITCVIKNELYENHNDIYFRYFDTAPSDYDTYVSDCDIGYHNETTKLTRATIKKSGSIKQVCSDCGKVLRVVSTINQIKGPALSATSYTYSGSYKKPTVTLIDIKGKKISSSNYSISYANNKSVGLATVNIALKNNYSGTIKTTYRINPKGTSISKLSRAKRAFTVKWKKQSEKMSASRISGYQIRYSTSSKMSNPKTVSRSGYENTSKKITGLKSKKKYYVQIRTYKTVNKVKYYSSWSTKKTVTTK